MVWRDLKIKWKLALGFSAILACLVGLASLSWTCAHDVSTQLENIENESVHFALLGKDLQFHNVQVQQWLTDISATRGMEGFDDGFAEAEAHAIAFRSILTDYRNHSRHTQDQRVVKAIAEVEDAFEGYYAMGKEMAAVYIDKGPEAGNQMMEKFDPYAETINERLAEFVALQTHELDSTLHHTNDELNSLMRSGTVITLCGILGSFVIVGFTTWSITSPLHRAIHFAEVVAGGDLSESAKISQRDEIGQLGDALNTMVRNLREIVTSVTEKSISLASASSALSNTATGMVGGATLVASNANQLAHSSHSSLGRLDAAAGEIGKVVDSIHAVAERTNLLALNASIEAARAGEAGSGFAIVAHEVKNLATQTAEATDDIRRRIGEIQASSLEATDSIGQILHLVSEVSEMSTMIAATLDESTTRAVTKSINGVDDAIRKTADGASQTRVASVELSHVASELQTLVGQFTTRV